MSPDSATPFRVEFETSSAAPTACFSILAESEPGLMPRLIEAFAKRALVPDFLCSRRLGAEIAVDIHVAGLDGALTEQIAQSFRQIPTVRWVLLCVKAH